MLYIEVCRGYLWISLEHINAGSVISTYVWLNYERALERWLPGHGLCLVTAHTWVTRTPFAAYGNFNLRLNKPLNIWLDQ